MPAWPNPAFRLPGASLNISFPLYAILVVTAATVLIKTLAGVDATAAAGRFRANTPARALGGSLLFIAAGLTTVWIGTWAPYVFAGRPTPVDPEVFKLVAALDLTLIVPALGLAGILLWRRRPCGFIIATAASVQAALYLLVLTVNSFVLIARGLTGAPGEVPVWGALVLFTPPSRPPHAHGRATTNY